MMTTMKTKTDKDNGCVSMMTGQPTYLTADCEAAKPNMSQVDGGGNTLSKNEEPVWFPRLSPGEFPPLPCPSWSFQIQAAYLFPHQ